MSVQGRRVVQGRAHGCFFTFRRHKGVHKCTQPIQRRHARVLQNGLQKAGGLPPFLTLKPKKYGRFVGKILVQRTNADPGPFGHACSGKTLRSLSGQNASGSLKNRGHHLGRPCLTWLFSLNNFRFLVFAHGCGAMRMVKCEYFVIFYPYTHRRATITRSNT